MRSFVLKFAITAAALLVLHFGIVLYVPAPLKAEYWVREAVIVKETIMKYLENTQLLEVILIDLRIYELIVGAIPSS